MEILGLIYRYSTESYLLGSTSLVLFGLFLLTFLGFHFKNTTNLIIINISTFFYCFMFPTSIIYTPAIREAYLLLF